MSLGPLLRRFVERLKTDGGFVYAEGAPGWLCAHPPLDVSVEVAGLPAAVLEQLRRGERVAVQGMPSLLALPLDGTRFAFVGVSSVATRCWSEHDLFTVEILRDVFKAVLLHHVDEPPAVECDEAAAFRPVSQEIVRLFEALRRPSCIRDDWEASGRRLFEARVANCVASSRPIRFCLPAFPMKNVDAKGMVLGPMPDVGEALALKRLGEFCERVSALHAPGCSLVLVTDGRVFNDLYPVPDADVTRYHAAIECMARALGPRLSLLGLDDFFPAFGNAQKRDAILALYEGDAATVAAKIETDPHFRGVYLSFKRLLLAMQLPRPKAASTAKLMMLRNEAYSALINLVFSSCVRLSIHDHSGLEKIGIFLVGTSIVTPWHGVAALLRDGSWVVLRRHEAESRGFELIDANDHLPLLGLQRMTAMDTLLYYRER